MKSDPRFVYLFWFCAYVFTLGYVAMVGLLVLDIPDKNREMASNAQGFIQATLIGSALGFAFTGNIIDSQRKKTNTPGAVTGEITASITTEPSKEEPNATY